MTEEKPTDSTVEDIPVPADTAGTVTGGAKRNPGTQTEDDVYVGIK